MVIQEEIAIWFPKVNNLFNEENNSFTINKIKSRVPSVVYFKVHCYDMNDKEINKDNQPVNKSEAYYNSQRWLIDKTYSSYTDTFDITEETLQLIKEVQIELRIIGVTDNNPLYFTECMLMNKEFDGVQFYETDEKIIPSTIDFNNMRYSQLYRTGTEDYLQIIRPEGGAFTSLRLTPNNCTVLAPHLVGETQYDNPTNLYLEFINQTEQTTNIKMI